MSETKRTGIRLDRDVEFPVVDVDAHYTTTFEELVDYMDDGPSKSRFVSQLGGGPDIKGTWPRAATAEYRKPQFAASTDWWDEHAEAEWYDAPKTREDILDVMDQLQIDKIFLFDNLMLLLNYIKGRDERPTVYANAYIDYMLDKVADPERGIYVGVPIPHQDPDEAAELVDRVGGEPGVAGAVFIGGIVEPPLGDRQYDVVYEAIERAGLPVIVHGDSGDMDNFYMSGYSNYLEVHSLGFLWGNLGQLTSIVVQGVPEKFPGLDFVFMESGIFYIPAAMYRMDAEFLRNREQAPMLTKRPSEYMKESFYFGTQPLEVPSNPSYFSSIIEMIGGAERLMYASDYPHTDYDVPTAISEMPGLSDGEKKRILSRNAEEVFGI